MTLDVLLLEASPGDGSADALHLSDAGHRVHRCFDAHGGVGAVHPSGWVPCRALTAGDCPFDGSIDVAVLARRGVAPRPGPREVGVRCAVRSGVPIVEDGGDLLDPFDEWIARRTIGADVVAACEAAATEAFRPVVDQLRAGSVVLLADLGIDGSAIDAVFEVDGDHLVVRLIGPAVPASVGRALCDRARDAVKTLPRRFRTTDVGYSSDGGPSAQQLGTNGPDLR